MTFNSVIFALATALSTIGQGTRAAEVHLAPHTFTLPDGFEIEMVAGPPLVMRPMMADFDDLGRLHVADSSGSNDKVEKQLAEKPHRILRLEDTDGDGHYDQSTVFADKLMFPEGVLWHDGAIYTGAPPSIWKLEDTDGDGVADRRTEWHQGLTLTGCANDLHGPYAGPDGWIYWCKGGFAKQTYERPGQRTISDGAAHEFRALPDRTELDAVIGGGMDNPVEVAFSVEGELFFITTFFHHPEAGKRDAIVHGIYGGAYPKVQGVVEELQRTGELLPALVELGPAAGCSLARYDSQGFGPEYEHNLFSAEFNLRRVRRHILSPWGSTYRSLNEDFLVSDNPDFHPTDGLEDADGSLLVVDTGGWYKICCPTSQLPKPDVLGGIYRIRRKGMAAIENPRELGLTWSGAGLADLADRLEDPRSVVRQKAIRQLAFAGAEAVPALTTVLRESDSRVQRRNAVWSLTRMEGEAARAAVRIALDDADDGVRQAALHAVAMRRDREAQARVVHLLNSADPFHRRKAAEALGRMGEIAGVPALLAAAAKLDEGLPEDAAALRIQEHAVIYALIEIGDATATRVGLTAKHPGTRRAALIALDQMDHGGLRVDDVVPLLTEPDPGLKSAALWTAGNHSEWGAELAGYFREQLARVNVPAEVRRDLQRHLTVFERDAAIQQLVADQLDNDSLEKGTRLLLLRSMAESRLPKIPAVWIAALGVQLAGADETIARSAIEAIRALPLEKAEVSGLNQALWRLAGDPSKSEDLRVEAMAAVTGAMGTLEETHFELLRNQLDPALSVSRRGAAAQVLARAALSSAQLLELAGAMKAVGPMELNRLLEAVLYPSASFVRNYEPVIAATKAGDEYGGVLVSETADDLVLNLGADSRVRVAKADLTELRPGAVSVMPTGLEELLTAQELADLLAFLKHTRWGAQ